MLTGIYLFGAHFSINVNAITYLMVNAKNRNLKRKNKHVLTLSELSIILKHSGRHMALSRLVTLSIPSLRNLDIEANKFYDRAH